MFHYSLLRQYNMLPLLQHLQLVNICYPLSHYISVHLHYLDLVNYNWTYQHNFEENQIKMMQQTHSLNYMYCHLSLPLHTLPSVDKGIHGFAPQICDSAALLSLGVRPVRLVPVPCRITNLRRKTPSAPNHRLLVAGKATDGGVLGVRRLTLTRPAAKTRRLGRVSPCPLRVNNNE